MLSAIGTHELELVRTEGGMRTTSMGQTKEVSARVYNEVPIGLCYFDQNLRYVHVNDRLASINGVSVEEHLGRKISEVLPDVAAGVESLLQRVIETGEPIVGGTVSAETPADPGNKRFFQHSYSANQGLDNLHR